MTFHNWRDALAYALGAGHASGTKRSVTRDREHLVWRVQVAS